MKYLIPLLILGACSQAPMQLTEKATQLEVFATKPTDCQVVGKVVGTDSNGSKELALNDALNRAAKLKASGLYVNQEVPNGGTMMVYGTAYRCD